MNSFPTPRTLQAGALIHALDKVKLKRDRQHFVDRGKGTCSDVIVELCFDRVQISFIMGNGETNTFETAASRIQAK